MDNEQLIADESGRSTSSDLPDSQFDRILLVAGGFTFAAAWVMLFWLRRLPFVEPDAAMFFWFPALAGTFLGITSMLAGAVSRRIVQGFARAVILFVFFPVAAFGLAVLLKVDLGTVDASALSLVPGVLLGPAGYSWIARDYHRNRQQ